MVEGSQQTESHKKVLESQKDHPGDMKNPGTPDINEAAEAPSIDTGHPPAISEETLNPELTVSSFPVIISDGSTPVTEARPSQNPDEGKVETDEDKAGLRAPEESGTSTIDTDTATEAPEESGTSNIDTDTATEAPEESGISNIEDGVRDITSANTDSLADLLISEGSDIDLDEISSQFDTPHEELDNEGELPDEIETVWEKTIKEIAYGEDAEEEVEEEVQKISFFQKLKNIFSTSDYEVDVYDPAIHGPLVDLTLTSANLEEVQFYEVYPPYSFVRITHDPELHEYVYEVIEPELTDKELSLLETVKERLVETLSVSLRDSSKDEAENYLREHVDNFLKEYRIKLTTITREKIMYFIIRDFLGYGEIDTMMRDMQIEDISCDGPQTPIYVYHRKFESIPASVMFRDDDHLDYFVIRIAQICGKHISIANPLLDATMPDGSRIQLTLGREVTTRGSTFTIRRFNENPIIPADLVEYHTFSTAMMAYLWLAVDSSKSIIFSGGTASGKTTAMNAISMFIQPEMKVVSIEDTRELNLAHPNWIPGVTRESFAGEEKGSIEMYELLRASLRQRPEYILVGEVRGAEAYVLFQAMSTGHTTFSTIHADSVQSIVHRLENPPINVPRIMIQALDIVSVQAQVKVGDDRVRRSKSLTEIVGVDPRTGELLTNEVFIWNAAKDSFQYSGRSYVIENVMENMGWDEVRVRRELQQRQEVIEWTRLKSIKDYKAFSKIVVAYRREPETLMKLVRKDLGEYEN